ncbi:FKBP-type peptidyl-prolyl cis-trans isomerase SlyD (EC [Olavius algarvensis associated proteobacterium Delta 3]|nr:FKBP-type peptidyl-prolyl cis-trans isomerase SlyD (EC [Olavius algarvensis associated proteobacterium Delta 3]CAB5166983.1 FKBP-type peptidyl-prolyl cis-trans isomerase SlyD (EC [Olavius algarvensis associated proteobacterium Delta 3]
MTQAKSGDNVKVHYTGKLQEGDVFDSSDGREPLEFRIGDGKVIAGFEQGVVGMEVGDKKQISIPPEQGYGVRNEEIVAVIERELLPKKIDTSVGQQLQVKQQDGTVLQLMVTAETEENVTLDANHPLAGKTLLFDVELVEIA